jgi:ergothioneine biosynthesis protein EgtB
MTTIPRASADVLVRTNVQAGLLERYITIRQFTQNLVNPLTPEDCTTQSMPDASPTKWHLAHTSWFFETLVLAPNISDYKCFDPAFSVLFNSYYNSLGKQHPRPRRGLLSRPSLERVLQYRQRVDRHMIDLLSESLTLSDEAMAVVEVGLNHEQQHQELILTDIKHLFFCNPLRPAYSENAKPVDGTPAPLGWTMFPEDLRWIGHEVQDHVFAYDNESPRHRVFMPAFEIANRLVTNREYLEFMDDGGYERPELWLSDGWAAVQSEGWDAPMYWEMDHEAWNVFTLGGERGLGLDEPVNHVSYFEADAYARWAGARLPTEAEWETVARDVDVGGNFVDEQHLHPIPMAGSSDGMLQLYGDVWEWTKSGYEPYPGYRAPEGPLGEYNSKFMCSQLVLRGGSCATSRSHLRSTYRNFFPAPARWQFSGFRLCRDSS